LQLSRWKFTDNNRNWVLHGYAISAPNPVRELIKLVPTPQIVRDERINTLGAVVEKLR